MKQGVCRPFLSHKTLLPVVSLLFASAYIEGQCSAPVPLQFSFCSANRLKMRDLEVFLFPFQSFGDKLRGTTWVLLP